MPWRLALGHAGRHHAESAVSPCRAFPERPAVLIDRYLIRETTSSFSAVAIILMVVFLAYSLTRFLAEPQGSAERSRSRPVDPLQGHHRPGGAPAARAVLRCDRGLRTPERTRRTGRLRAGGVARRIYRPLILLALGLALAVGALDASASGGLRRMTSSRHRRKRPRNSTGSSHDAFISTKRGSQRLSNRSAAAGAICVASSSARAPPTASKSWLRRARTLTPFVTPTRHRLVLHDASIYQAPTSHRTCSAVRRIDLGARRADGGESRIPDQVGAIGRLHGSSNPDDRAELQWRLSTPLSTFLLTLAGLALVDQRPRQGRFARLPAAIGVYAVYYNLLGLARTWVEQDIVPHLWWAPALLALGIAFAVVNGLRRQGLQHA